MFHPDNNNDNAIGFTCGVLGGVIKFYLIDIPESFWLQFIEAIITAFACGIAGVLGKHLISKILKSKKEK